MQRRYLVVLVVFGAVATSFPSWFIHQVASANGVAPEVTRSVKFINSTEDVNSVRVHCLHFDGRSFFRDVNRGEDVIVENTLVGERVVAAYDLSGKIIALKNLDLRQGDDPAVVGVFGNSGDGYRIDVGL